MFFKKYKLFIFIVSLVIIINFLGFILNKNFQNYEFSNKYITTNQIIAENIRFYKCLNYKHLDLKFINYNNSNSKYIYPSLSDCKDGFRLSFLIDANKRFNINKIDYTINIYSCLDKSLDCQVASLSESTTDFSFISHKFNISSLNTNLYYEININEVLSRKLNFLEKFKRNSLKKINKINGIKQKTYSLYVSNNLNNFFSESEIDIVRKILKVKDLYLSKGKYGVCFNYEDLKGELCMSLVYTKNIQENLYLIAFQIPSGNSENYKYFTFTDGVMESKFVNSFQCNYFYQGDSLSYIKSMHYKDSDANCCPSGYIYDEFEITEFGFISTKNENDFYISNLDNDKMIKSTKNEFENINFTSNNMGCYLNE